MTRPGVLAVRAINQYRRRDVIAYLGLRYYLDNKAAQQDIWASTVATRLEVLRDDPGYLQVKHFKEVDEQGAPKHRDLFLPRPNEALAEAALIGACAAAGGHFRPSKNVYSYAFATGRDRSGVFRNYMHGLQDRHDAITKACEATPEAIVCFRDLQRFYPSISISLARRVWESACKSSSLEPGFVALGQRLLDRHGTQSNGYLLIGPIFSHLIGNLVMREVDEEMGNGRAHYLRYVDDITLVGNRNDISHSSKQLESVIERLQLSLHPAGSVKSLDVSRNQWMDAKNDFKQSPGEDSWMSLIDDVKNLLLWHPGRASDLSKMLYDGEFRIPLLSYSGAIKEADYASSALRRIRSYMHRKRTRFITPASVLEKAQRLRQKYRLELEVLTEKLASADSFLTKRLTPMMRYRIGRLSYLADSTALLSAAVLIEKFPGLRFHSEVARAIATSNVDRLLPLGTNAAQAAAQPLRTFTDRVGLSYEPRSEAEFQSLAVLAFNGVIPRERAESQSANELHQFAINGGSRDLMKSPSRFIAEVSSLHGIGEARHANVLDTAFDVDETFTLDAVDQARTSLSM